MSIWSKIYNRINWKNYPSTETALNETNLNKMDAALEEIDNRVVELSGYQEIAKEYATQANESATNAKESEVNAKESEEKAYDYMVQASSFTPQGYNELVEEVAGHETRIENLEQRPSGSSVAKDVSYDNSISESESTNVQDAMDEAFANIHIVSEELENVPILSDSLEPTEPDVPRDADTLGGRYTANDIDTIMNLGTIKSGTVTNSGTLRSVTFDEPFDNVPTVVVTPQSYSLENGGRFFVRLYDVTKTGFSFYLFAYDGEVSTGLVVFNYIAHSK